MKLRAASILLLVVALTFPGFDVDAAPKNRRGAVVSPVRLEPIKGSVLGVAGLHSYLGSVEFRSASDGLVVVNRLSLERYLLGLNEVPLDWPMEALRAQAIAARTYALWTLGQPRGGSAGTYGFDICATVACQVFSGADVLLTNSEAERWREAVDSTRGLVALYDGEPILARYHSTSGGRTFDNETIFPSEGPFPYLKGVDSNLEEGSPLDRWRFAVPLKQMQILLQAVGLWERANGKLREMRSVSSGEGNHYSDIVAVGSKRDARFTAEEMRALLRETAPARYPGLFPAHAPTGSGRLPETFPSNRYDVDTRGKRVVILGRGWGHGVGMSQWGAEGMARLGANHEQILRHYYTGIEVESYPENPVIDVGVAWGLDAIDVLGAFHIRDGQNRSVVPDAVGTWSFRAAGSGAVSVKAPRRFDLPLRVGIVNAPETVVPGEQARLTVALAAPAALHAKTLGGRRSFDPVVFDAGRRVVAWRAPDEPGFYDVVVIAKKGDDEQSDRVRIEVAEEVTRTAPDRTAPPAGGDNISWPPRLALVALVIAATLAAVKVTMSR